MIYPKFHHQATRRNIFHGTDAVHEIDGQFLFRGQGRRMGIGLISSRATM
jgi:hypothetical protein